MRERWAVKAEHSHYEQASVKNGQSFFSTEGIFSEETSTVHLTTNDAPLFPSLIGGLWKSIISGGCKVNSMQVRFLSNRSFATGI